MVQNSKNCSYWFAPGYMLYFACNKQTFSIAMSGYAIPGRGSPRNRPHCLPRLPLLLCCTATPRNIRRNAQKGAASHTKSGTGFVCNCLPRYRLSCNCGNQGARDLGFYLEQKNIQNLIKPKWTQVDVMAAIVNASAALRVCNTLI